MLKKISEKSSSRSDPKNDEPLMLVDLLIDAIRSYDSQQIIDLLRQGADPNGTLDSDGLTPLCFAISKNNITAIQILLAAGANIHTYISGHEYTVLEYAEQSRGADADIMKVLLQSENEVNKTLH